MINKIYLEEEVQEQIRETLEKEEAVQLREFLEPKVYQSLKKELEKKKYKKEYSPLERSYSTTNVEQNQLISEIEQILVKKAKSAKVEKYRKGDYTLLSDEDQEEEIIAILDFSENWPEEVGGEHIFLEEGKELIRIPPQTNTLSIITIKNKMRHFLNYINHKANSNKLLFIKVKF